MCGDIAFEPGKAYFATPAMLDAGPQRVLECIRRDAGGVTLADVSGIHRVPVRVILGRETAKFRTSGGIDYFASALVEASLDDVATAGRAAE